MKRRLDGEAELKCETGPAADDAASEGDVAQLVAALVAKELLAGLSGARARFGGVAFGGAQEAAVGDFLRQKLGKESLTRRPGPGGKRLTYIESCKAIELANRAFGFNGWSCRILECKEEYVSGEEAGGARSARRDSRCNANHCRRRSAETGGPSASAR